jgi:hypothetical protein
MREATTWPAMEILDHAWRTFNKQEIHHKVRYALRRLGFAEFQDRPPDHVRGRLTPEGIDFRDRVYKERARRTNAKLWPKG